MLTRKLKFNQTLEDNPCTSVVTSDEISAIICMYSGPCPVGNVVLKQKYYSQKAICHQTNTLNKHIISGRLFRASAVVTCCTERGTVRPI